MLENVIYKEPGIKKYLNRQLDKIRGEKRIILFGAGTGGINTYNWIKNSLGNDAMVECFLDNNSLKWGSVICGKPVYKPAMRLEEYNGELVIISCGEGDIIQKQLTGYGVCNDRILIPDISAIDLGGEDFDYIWTHIHELEAIYEMLGDDKSKKVFVNILNYRISHSEELIQEIYDNEEDQYFDKNLIHFNKADIFFNCGSYIGDTVENYVKHAGKDNYGKIYCCEADNENYEILRDRIAELGIKDFECFNVGLWKEKGSLRFNNIGSGSGYIGTDGSVEITTDTIDNILSGRKATFINMDIEGAEYNALLGAEKTIDKYKPALAISVYHKKEDFIKIPLLIRSFNPNYKLFFRHYRALSVQETVCYAILNNQK